MSKMVHLINDTLIEISFSRFADVYVYCIEPLIDSNTGRISRKLVYSYFGASNPGQLTKCKSVYL